MNSSFSIGRLGAALLPVFLAIWLLPSLVYAVEDTGKVGVVSFGLFGDQSVFRSEATR